VRFAASFSLCWSSDLVQFMYRYTKNCIFCETSPTTKEDVWPTWLTQYIPRTLKSYHGAIAEISPDGKIAKSQKKWDGDPRSRRASCLIPRPVRAQTRYASRCSCCRRL
jgi:hypothetical protein